MNMTDWLHEPATSIDSNAMDLARSHQNMLTKPQGALGELENIAITFAGFQGQVIPQLNKICVRVFAADHGVCAQNVSAFPQIVTTQMVQNFICGGAAISVLSRQLGADFSVVNMGIANPLIQKHGVLDHSIAPGTEDFSEQPAMTIEQCAAALAIGRDLINDTDTSSGKYPDLFIGGEMGIGNTSSAAAIYSALLDLPAELTVGPGTGLKESAITHKRSVVTKALRLHQSATLPLVILQCFGGFEIAALTGSYVAAAQRGIPILVDGFISTAAALLACKLNDSVRPWLIFSHQSAEPAHIIALEALQAQPLLNLNMRLGEGSGAAVAVPLIQSALTLHKQMATFDQAGVSAS